MKYENIIIEKKEYDILKHIIINTNHKIDPIFRASLDKFFKELKKVKILKINDMPEDVVRLNSIVSIKDSYNNIRKIEIVKPHESDLKSNRISILTPMGLALYGYALDDEILWQ